uniref:CRAL-TRIO domain-containing protein n=1 Tax=Mesocestoides corti TaxID=53468 RepID=A0A5K3FNW1_MESCO
MAASQKLPSKFVKLAKSELGEDPKNISAHIEAFRRWLSSMPHLTCPDDDNFLLMFLRHCKYVHSKAQARIDNFCTLSTMKCVGEEIWATPVDLKSKALRSYLDRGIHLPIGYTEDGKLVLCLRIGAWNPDEFDFSWVCYFGYKLSFMLANDPRTIIGGLVLLLDFSDVKSNQVVKDPVVIRTMVRYTQEALPGRVKRVIYYKEGKLVDAALTIFAFYMNEKMRSRILQVGSDITKAFEVEPGLKALLPSEMGAEGKSTEELIILLL